jgi:MFS family permease
MYPVTEAVGKPSTSSRSSPNVGPHLSAAASFNLLASITVAFLAGSSAPTPLYPLYQSLWGLSPVMITVVFGVYALAVLAGLLFAGRLSDHVGRRPVLMAAMLAHGAAWEPAGDGAGFWARRDGTRRRCAYRQRIYIILPSTGTSSSATMLMILIRGLIAGPAVSL